ncbi:MAG TPA: PEP-CTERM sorting domain-containing protein [Pirellulales bacterium]|jgi:hypothetical protein
MKLVKTFWTLGALLVTLLAAAESQATFTANLGTFNGGDGSININFNSGQEAVNTGQGGQFQWTVDSGPNPGYINYGSTGSFTSFCIEIPQPVSPGSTQYTYTQAFLPNAPSPINNPDTPMGLAAANEIAAMWQVEITGNGGSSSPVFTDPIARAAFQLAIWKLEYDKPLSSDVPAGLLTLSTPAANNAFWTTAASYVRVTNTLSAVSNPANNIIDLADKYMTSAFGQLASAGPVANLFAIVATNGAPTYDSNGLITNSSNQDQVVALPGGNGQLTTPEPGTFLIWSMLGLVGFGLRRRFRAK